MADKLKIKNLKLIASYQDELYVNPRLKFLFFELTDKCNLHCKHCGSNCTSANQNQLSFDSVKKVLDDVAKHLDVNEIMVCLTGGEPMLHPDVYKIIYYAKQLGFAVGMNTNGTLINSNTAVKLVDSGIDTISISIDGLEAEHDMFRGLSGSYKKAMNGIDVLKKVGVEPEIVTVVHKNNIHQLNDLYKIFKKFPIYQWRLINIEPIGRANQTDLFLNKEEYIKLFTFIENKRLTLNNSIDISYGCSHFLGYDKELELRDFYFQCIAGIRVASIASNGDIIACLDIERRADLVQGNIYKDSFSDIWINKFKEFRHNKAIESKICKNCKFMNVCRGDSFHTWDFDSKEPKLCLIKKLEGE